MMVVGDDGNPPSKERSFDEILFGDLLDGAAEVLWSFHSIIELYKP